jgi:hypothetical protein
MEGAGVAVGTVLFAGVLVVGAGALLHAAYHLVVLFRRSAEWAAGSHGASADVPPEVASQRRRVARSVIVFVLAWLVGWSVPVLAPGLLGLE